MADIFESSEYREDMALTCPDCGWTGTGREASMEMFRDLFHLECPNCPKIIAIFSFPTLEEGLKRGDPSAIRRKAFIDRLEKLCLKGPNQLPDVPGDHLEFLWDFDSERSEDGDHAVRLR